MTGALLSVFGLGVFLFGVIEGPERGWLSLEVLGSLVVGIGLLVAFVLRELRDRRAVVRRAHPPRRAVSAGSITLFTAYWIFTGMLFLLPSWLQEVQHESIVTVGLLLVPFAGVFGALSMRSTAPWAGWGSAPRSPVGCSSARWAWRCSASSCTRTRSRRCWRPSCSRSGCRS